MTKLHILLRSISPYSGADILLGVFSSSDALADARTSYLTRYRKAPSSDPWNEQGYRDDGLTDDDLKSEVMSVSAIPTDSQIYVVSVYHDYLGQVTREIDSLYCDSVSAGERLKAIESEADSATFEDLPPNNWDSTLVRIDELRSDAREVQPYG